MRTSSILSSPFEPPGQRPRLSRWPPAAIMPAHPGGTAMAITTNTAAMSSSEAGSAQPAPQRLRLGFLTHLHVGDDAADSYHAALDLFTAAEQLGYDSGWVAQHHFLNGG